MKFLFFSAALFILLTISSCSAAPTPQPANAPSLTPLVLPSEPPTAPPSPTPTLTPTPPPTQIPMLEGGCANPLRPLLEGSTMRYQVTNSFGEFHYTIQTSDHQIARTETMLLRYSDDKLGFEKTDKVACDHGAIYNYPSYTINMLFAGQLDKYIDTVHIEGNSYPNYATLADQDWAKQWDLLLMTEDGVLLTASGVPGWFAITPSSNIYEHYELTGIVENIETPAGGFTAFKVIHQFRLLGTIPPMFTDSQAGSMLFTVEEWYAPNIGLVRAELLGVSVESSGQSTDLPLSGTLELTEMIGIP